MTYVGLVILSDPMASLYRRPRSRFFWIKFRDPSTGKIRYQSTGIDARRPGALRKAKAEQANRTQKEMSAPRTNERERWEAWAEPYLVQRYRVAGTLKGARIALRDLMSFFKELDIRIPRQVDYDVAARFVPWRTSGKTLEPVHHNTALLRFKLLSVLMSEAVRRGFSPGNPCREVKIRREPSKQKEEISAEHEQLIEAALRTKAAWMLEQWHVLMKTGCRISETYIPLDRIDEAAERVTLRLKGGKLHPTRLHPALLPLCAKARAENRPTLIGNTPDPVPIWCQFFKALGLPYSAHCTRVTVITRMLRAGHSPAVVCARIGHSETVNVIYRRLHPDDTKALDSALGESPIHW